MKTKQETWRIFYIIGIVMIIIALCPLVDYIGGLWLVFLLFILFLIIRVTLAFTKYDPRKYGWHCYNCGKRVENGEVDHNGVHKKCGYDCDYGIYKDNNINTKNAKQKF